MSSQSEKRAEGAEKSSQKKEKKRKGAVDDSREEMLPIATPSGMGKNDEEKKAKKERKAEKKRLKREAEEEANKSTSNGNVDVEDDSRPVKRNKTGGEAEQATNTASAKKAKEATPAKVTDSAAARAYMESNAITIEAPEESEEKPPLPMLSFAELKGRIDERLERELERNKFQKPTPIQACCWSVLLADRDVVGIAETG